MAAELFDLCSETKWKKMLGWFLPVVLWGHPCTAPVSLVGLVEVEVEASSSLSHSDSLFTQQGAYNKRLLAHSDWVCRTPGPMSCIDFVPCWKLVTLCSVAISVIFSAPHWRWWNVIGLFLSAWLLIKYHFHEPTIDLGDQWPLPSPDWLHDAWLNNNALFAPSRTRSALPNWSAHPLFSGRTVSYNMTIIDKGHTA